MTKGKKALILIGVVVLGFVLSMITKNGIFFFLCLLAAVVAVIVMVVRWFKGKRLVEVLGAEPPTKARPAKYRFSVAGLYYREDALLSVAQRHADFGLSDADFVEKHKGGRPVFEYRLQRGAEVSLVPEPTNEHDPNAIAVYISGKQIGYVPAGETGEVRQYLTVPHSVRAWISGGASKRVQEGRVVTKASQMDVEVEIEETK